MSELKNLKEQRNLLIEQAIDISRERYSFELVYDEESLDKLEQILARAANEYERSKLTQDITHPQLARTAEVWGAYFGELLCRLLDFKWSNTTLEVSSKYATLKPIDVITSKIINPNRPAIRDIFRNVRDGKALFTFRSIEWLESEIDNILDEKLAYHFETLTSVPKRAGLYFLASLAFFAFGFTGLGIGCFIGSIVALIVDGSKQEKLDDAKEQVAVLNTKLRQLRSELVKLKEADN